MKKLVIKYQKTPYCDFPVEYVETEDVSQFLVRNPGPASIGIPDDAKRTSVDYVTFNDKQFRLLGQGAKIGVTIHAVYEETAAGNVYHWDRGDRVQACANPKLAPYISQELFDLIPIRQSGVRADDVVAKVNDVMKGGKESAALFFEELLDSVDTLGGIAEEHGVRTLVDLMYLQNAILKGTHIDHLQKESDVMEIASGLPSGANWLKFIQSKDYVPLSELQDDGYTFVQLEADLRQIVEDYAGGINITGAVVKIGDGEYEEVWVTESSRPFELSAMYEKLPVNSPVLSPSPM